MWTACIFSSLLHPINARKDLDQGSGKYSFKRLLVCFGSLSCWKTHWCRLNILFADSPCLHAKCLRTLHDAVNEHKLTDTTVGKTAPATSVLYRTLGSVRLEILLLAFSTRTLYHLIRPSSIWIQRQVYRSWTMYFFQINKYHMLWHVVL